jgi:DUF218 domain
VPYLAGIVADEAVGVAIVPAHYLEPGLLASAGRDVDRVAGKRGPQCGGLDLCGRDGPQWPAGHHAARSRGTGCANQPPPAAVVAARYRDGLAPLVIVTGGINRHNGVVEGQMFRRLLTAAGVPDAAIRVEDQSANTWQNVGTIAAVPA